MFSILEKNMLPQHVNDFENIEGEKNTSFSPLQRWVFNTDCILKRKDIKVLS